MSLYRLIHVNRCLFHPGFGKNRHSRIRMDKEEVDAVLVDLLSQQSGRPGVFWRARRTT